LDSFILTDTYIQTDTTEIIHHAASRVINDDGSCETLYVSE